MENHKDDCWKLWTCERTALKPEETASYERYTTRTQSWITDERLLKVDARKRVVDADSLKAVAELTRSRNQTWAGQFPLADVISNQVM